MKIPVATNPIKYIYVRMRGRPATRASLLLVFQNNLLAFLLLNDNTDGL